ncbi:MAG: hypothetical protein K5864_09650 [Bacteroidales bacterium]|nr:hypothetical protein [Bacteroidales bacterium]
MKKVVTFAVLLLCGAMLAGTACAQNKDDIKKIRKEREEISKMTREELNTKASKSAIEEAQNLKKEGWKAPAGALPIDKQLDRSYNMQYELDESLMPKYLMGSAMSTGTAYDAARMQAVTLAKQELAGQVATEVSALVESKMENSQLSEDEAQSIVQAAEKSQELIAQSLGRITTVMELYREKDKKTEVLVRVAYRTDQILKTAKEVIRKELESRGDGAQERIDEVFEK